MSTETQPPRSLGAVMSAEAGYDAELDDSPLRISGFISLLLGILGGFAIVATPMVAVSIAGVFFGLFALRKHDSKHIPVGTTAAKIGIFLSLMFTAWGIALPTFKQATLGSQAEYFAKQYIKVVCSGNLAYAAELQKSYVNRFMKTMPLEQFYANQKLAREEQRRKELQEGGAGEESTPMEEDSASLLAAFDADHEWYLDRPVRVYHHYGRQMAEVILVSDRSSKPTRLMVIMEYSIHKDRKSGEWKIETFQTYRERLVAETVL